MAPQRLPTVLLASAAICLAIAQPDQAEAWSHEGLPQNSRPEFIAEILIHGNHTTPDADVLALAGLVKGDPATTAKLAEAEDRLRRSGRFDDVEVRKRFRSIDDPSEILVVILIDERATAGAGTLGSGPLSRLPRLGRDTLWLPVLNYADGYGFTYGARATFVDVFGRPSRLSVPLTWGGERRAGVEIDRNFTRGPVSRAEGGVAIYRRVNPFFDLADMRREARVKVQRSLTPWLRAGTGVTTALVDFGELHERRTAAGVELVVDTRVDPTFPRNAVYATASWERVRFSASGRAARWTTDLRGYLGLWRSTVVAARAATSRSDRLLPAYEQPLLGGTQTLRGYRFGYRAGDNLAVGSLEWRVPLTSPLNLGRAGVKAFVDVGTVYRSGQPLSGRRFDRGAGAGVFLHVAAVGVGLDVAWPRTGRPRLHFSLGTTF